MRRWVYSDDVGPLASAGLLLLRLVMGTAFLLHGWPKIQHPLDWMGLEATVPPALQCAEAWAEFGGGSLLILGLLTRLGALGILANMIVALALVHVPAGQPFVGRPGEPSFELPAVYLTCALLLLLAGAGQFSFDALLFGRGAGRPAVGPGAFGPGTVPGGAPR